MDVAVVAPIILQMVFALHLGRNVGFVIRRVTCVACVRPFMPFPSRSRNALRSNKEKRLFLERENLTFEAVALIIGQSVR